MKVYRVCYEGRYTDGFFFRPEGTPQKFHDIYWAVRDMAGDLDVSSPIAHPSPFEDVTGGMKLRDFWLSLSSRDTPLGEEKLRKDYRFGCTSKKQLKAIFAHKKIRDYLDANNVMVLVLNVPKKHLVRSAYQCIFKSDKAEIVDHLKFSDLFS